MLVPCEGDLHTHTQTLSDIFLKEYHALSKEYRIKGFCIEIERKVMGSRDPTHPYLFEKNFAHVEGEAGE